MRVINKDHDKIVILLLPLKNRFRDLLNLQRQNYLSVFKRFFCSSSMILVVNEINYEKKDVL